MRGDVATAWHLFLTQAAAPASVPLVATTAVALLLVLWRPVWRVTRYAVTIVHEGGHALVGLLAGRRLRGIRLHSDSSGLTVSRGRPTGFGVVLTFAAGYPAPALVGLAGSLLLAAGHAPAVLIGALLVLLATLVLVRNAFGVLIVAVAVLVLVGGVLVLPAGVGSALPTLLCLVLVFGGIRSSVEVARSRRHSRGTSDPDALARLSHVPAVLWVGFFVLVGLGAAAAAVIALGLPGAVLALLPS